MRRLVDQRHHPIEYLLGRQRHPRLGVVGDRLDAVQRAVPPGGIDRDGHHAGVEATEKCGDELQTRRIQQQRPLARQIVRLQPGPDGSGLPVQFADS